MKRRLHWLLIFFIWLLSAMTSAQELSPAPCDVEGGELRSHTYYSPILSQTLRYRVYLPPCYTDSQAYPMLILLHGSNRTDEHWQLLGIQPTLDALIRSKTIQPVVVLMPFGTWIANENRFEGSMTWSNVLMSDFIPHAEQTYSLQSERIYRAIGGISRGGFWAFNVGMRFPESFGAIGGHSPFFDEGHFPQAYNPLWLAVNAPDLKRLHLWLDRGENDYAQLGIDLMHTRLSAQGIFHEYALVPEGEHQDAYWSGQLETYLRWYDQTWGQEAITRYDTPELLPRVRLSTVPSPPSDANTTRVLVSGVTALARATREALNRHGIEEASSGLSAVTQGVDFFHISNETAFDPLCPRASQPVLGGLCSQPEHFGLFSLLGVDVVELTGNHNNDWGYEANAQTIQWLREQGFLTVGGGLNAIEATQTLTLTHHGNRIAWIACNWTGPEFAFATESLPGAGACRGEWLKLAIESARQTHDVVIVTLQHVEIDRQTPATRQEAEFRQVASWGADVVLGTQAHRPQSYELYLTPDRRRVFIHYGLGNLFFDQTTPPKDQFFLDEIVITAGQVTEIVLYTGVIEGQMRPRLHTPAEQEAFLAEFSP